jgi:orotate phosphoribosyltransferase
MKKPDRLLAEKLLQISAVKLQPDMPFVLGTGWNSPIYNDNRRVLSYPEVRNFIKIELAKHILENYQGAEVVASVSTSAIPFGMLVADALGLPFIYVRNSPKDHGLENMIEGNLRPGQKVVLLEDIVSTGGGSTRGADTVRQLAGEVLGGVCVFNYEFPKALKRLQNDKIHMESLCTYKTLIDVAVATNYIPAEEADMLMEWSKDPENWVPEA